MPEDEVGGHGSAQRGDREPFSTPIQRALDFLRASRPGEMVSLRRTDRQTFASPFAAALVLDIVTGMRKADVGGSIVQSHVTYLGELLEAGVGWRFSWDFRPLVPPDADDTACSIAVLWKAGFRRERLLPLLERLRMHRSPSGYYWTWIAPDETGVVDLDDVDIVVNINVAYALRTARTPDRSLERRIVQHIGELGLCPASGSSYYRSAAMVAYFLSRLAQRGGPGPNQFPRILDDVAAGLTLSEGHLIHDTAWWVCAAQRWGFANTVLDTATRANLTDELSSTQRLDGSWHPGVLFVGPNGVSFESVVATTAIMAECYASLNQVWQ